MTPHTPDRIAARINIGQHPTPPAMELVINEVSYEEGYDSDGQLGPFFDGVRGEEGLGFYEEEVQVSDSSNIAPDYVTDGSNLGEDVEHRFGKTDAELKAMIKKI